VRKKILVIDDEELLVKTFTRLLERLKYDVSIASRPEDAIAMAEEESFDLVLCDIRMPGKNGVETIREMRTSAEKRGKKVAPVIFLTGFADKKLEQEAQTLNPAAYIYKPFDTSELLEVIETGLKIHTDRDV